MSTPDDLEHKIKKLHITTRADTDERILDDAFAELESYAQAAAAAGGRGIFLKVLRNRTKELVAVAALVLIVVALFLSVPSAKAVTLAEIYEALEKVKNVCILRFQVGREEPFSKQWKARFMRLWLIETNKYTALWDLENCTKKIIDKKANSLSEAPIQPDKHKRLEDSFMKSFGFLPFSDAKAVEKDAEWNRVDVDSISTVIPGTEVYDLTWIRLQDEYITLYNKWRVYVDVKTNLPVRSEFYRKQLYHKRPSNSDDDYVLTNYRVVTYPTDAEVLAQIEDIFGEVEQQTAEPEDFNNPEAAQIKTNTEQ